MGLAAYGTLALDHIERRALYADRVDWPTTRKALARAAAGATTPAQLHPAIRSVVRQAGGEHSGLLPPTRASRSGVSKSPRASVMQGRGVLVLPSCPGDLRSAWAYAVHGGKALRRLPPTDGWVVDLRGNEGGSMWPMLAVALPLLEGDGVLGAFVTRDGTSTPWWARGRRVGVGRRTSARSRGPLRLPGPVAVLTDERTASSAEAVAVAFRGVSSARSYGAATRGLSTGNEAVLLPDGALLVITSCRFADRTGALYGGPLAPDVAADNALEVALSEVTEP